MVLQLGSCNSLFKIYSYSNLRSFLQLDGNLPGGSLNKWYFSLHIHHIHTGKIRSLLVVFNKVLTNILIGLGFFISVLSIHWNLFITQVLLFCYPFLCVKIYLHMVKQRRSKLGKQEKKKKKRWISVAGDSGTLTTRREACNWLLINFLCVCMAWSNDPPLAPVYFGVWNCLSNFVLDVWPLSIHHVNTLVTNLIYLLMALAILEVGN